MSWEGAAFGSTTCGDSERLQRVEREAANQLALLPHKGARGMKRKRKMNEKRHIAPAKSLTCATELANLQTCSLVDMDWGRGIVKSNMPAESVATRRFDLAATFERMVPQTRPVGKGTKRDPSERGGRGGDTATAGGDTATADEAPDSRAFGDTNDDLPRADAIRLPW